MQANIIYVLLFGGIALILYGVVEQLSKSRNGPKRKVRSPREAIRVQDAGRVQKEEVEAAARKFKRTLERYSSVLKIGPDLRRKLSCEALRVILRNKREADAEIDKLYHLFQRQLLRTLEVIVFHDASTNTEQAFAAQIIAKRALTFLTLASRYELREVFTACPEFDLEISHPVGSFDTEYCAVVSQVDSVQEITPRDAHWVRSVGYPVREFNFNGRVYPVFSISRGSTEGGLAAFRTKASFPTKRAEAVA